ncbi:hypothetical protein VPNG_07913 [Cytospora leucostoma]|uniref:Uncharacterized protein n=1 Tax=Cytospora leucostoma TaxID=1230097 RepID=A0A423WAZ2_9PEZI|nr:hypothetical protein VPNG_07913 [Cytospora leucostoma]
MRCSSHIAILSVLLAAASSTPVRGDDSLLADLADEEHMEAILSPAVPRQVYTGHHGPSDEQAVTTDASPSTLTSTPDEIAIAAEPVRVRPQLNPRQASTSVSTTSTSTAGTLTETLASATYICTNAPSTIRVTVVSTATMIMNVATLWPGNKLHADLLTPAADGPPFPTTGLLQLHQQQKAWEKKRAVRIIPGHDATDAGDAAASEEDAEAADEILFYNPGGIMLAPAPPLPTGEASAQDNQSGCTTTLLGAISNPCRVQGPMTVHTATTTVYSSIECNACTSVKVVQPMWGCPFRSTGSSVTAATPSTFTSTVCAAATAVPNQTGAGAEVISAEDTATASAPEASVAAAPAVAETSSATGTA